MEKLGATASIVKDVISQHHRFLNFIKLQSFTFELLTYHRQLLVGKFAKQPICPMVSILQLIPELNVDLWNSRLGILGMWSLWWGFYYVMTILQSKLFVLLTMSSLLDGLIFFNTILKIVS